MRERSAIVHPDIDRTPVVEIRHPDDARQRQRAMCGADLVHVEDFAVRRRLAVELRTVPGSDAARKRVVKGKRVSVRVDLGGGRIINKKKRTNNSYTQLKE